MQVNPERNPRYVRLRGMASVKDGRAGFRDVDVVMGMSKLYLYSTVHTTDSVYLSVCMSLLLFTGLSRLRGNCGCRCRCRWKVVPVWWKEASYYGVLSGWVSDGGSFPDNDVRWYRVMDDDEVQQVISTATAVGA